MFSFTRAMKFGATCIAVLALLLAVSMPSQAQEGTVQLHIVKAGFIIGFGALVLTCLPDIRNSC